MAHSETTVRIRRPADVVFEAIQQHAWTNEPAWEAEVLGVKPLDERGPRVGGRVAMTRKDRGRTFTTTYEITVLESPRRLAIRHVDGPMDFALEFRVVPAGSAESDVTAAVDMSPRGRLRILAPVFALMGPSRNARLTKAMAVAIETSTAPSPTGEALAPA
jgi:Polyketide cyclase / dehydrase and lipid transport